MTDEVWTIGRILSWTQSYFAEKDIESARLDAELLLAHVLGRSRVYLYTNFDQPLTPAERQAYRELVLRRCKHEPVAYILGDREFYGRAFKVTHDVLVPRPETEHLVDAVLEWLAEKELLAPATTPSAQAESGLGRLADLGTGSGIIAVSLAAELPLAQLVAVDISPAAVAIARENAVRHSVADRIEFLAGNLAEPLAGRGPFRVIAANLPYVPAGDAATLAADVREHEPHLALFSGADGLTLITKLIKEAPGLLGEPGLLALEIGAGQWPKVQALLVAAGFTRVWSAADLQGHARVALGER